MKHWKAEFEKAILESNSVIKIQNLKNGHIPRKLFKYRTFDKDGHWEQWTQGRVFCNNPLNFNDPFDCILSFESTSYSKTVRDVCFDVLRNRGIILSSTEYNSLNTDIDPINALAAILKEKSIHIDEDYVSRIANSTRFNSLLQKMLSVTCFSERNDSLLMWSHYADQHRGFCIEYDFSDDPEISEFLFPVVYSDKKAIVNTDIHDVYCLKAALCKSEEWQYEQEWRYINMLKSTLENSSATIIPYFDSPIRAVYLGVNTAQVDIDRLRTLIVQNQAVPKLYHMEMLDYKYKLIPKPLN